MRISDWSSDVCSSDLPYPFKELSGCGIGYKLIQAFLKKNDLPPEHAYQFLDLVAVSIASDIVPITDENRILAHFGLLKLAADPSPGLKALLKTAGITKNTLSRSEEHTSELQSLMRISYAVFCLTKNKKSNIK